MNLRVFSIIIGLGFAINVFPQDSLRHYIDIAIKNNPNILQKYYEYQAALQKVPQAGALSDPEFNIGVFLSPMELVSGNQIAELQLMQMFPWFGTLRAAKDEMSQMAGARYEQLRDAKLQVIFDVQNTWFTLYKINQNVILFEMNLEILRSVERLAIVKFSSSQPGSSVASEAPGSMPSANNSTPTDPAPAMNSMSGGLSGNTPGSTTSEPNSMGSSENSITLSDLYRIQIEIIEMENNAESLKNQRRTLAARFNSYLNRPSDAPVVLPDTLYADTLHLALHIAPDSMLANNPMLEMLHAERKSLESRKKMVSKMGYPMVGLGLNYSIINENSMSTSEMNGRDMIMPMVAITLPVYRKKYKAMLAETEMLQSATDQSLEASANELRTEYYQAIQSYDDAQRRLILYEKQRMLGDQTMDIMMKDFAASGAGLSEILRVRQQLLEYKYKLVEALADFNIAIARLNRLMAIG